MEQLVGDHSCYFRRIADKLVGKPSRYVDDLLHAGTPEFRDDITRILKDNFEIRIEDAKKFTFAGVDVCSKPYALTQSGYIKRLSNLNFVQSLKTTVRQEKKLHGSFRLDLISSVQSQLRLK
jgi:hypothetical protein